MTPWLANDAQRCQGPEQQPKRFRGVSVPAARDNILETRPGEVTVDGVGQGLARRSPVR